MANYIHLSELTKGYKHWNQWRRENPSVTPNLSKANLAELDLGLFDLRGANLKSALLTNTRLYAAKLHNADLSNANLSRASLNSAELISCNLYKANLSRADFRDSNLRKACLIAANLREANFSNAILSSANLTQGNLTKADFTSAVMRAVNLQDADLTAIQALGTNFEGAILTGACLESWNVNCKTILDDVYCEYIYQARVFGGKFDRRFPNDRMFAPGEFTRQFQPVSETTEFFFPNGIAELSLSLQALKQLYPDKVFAVREIESKERKAVLVRLEALPAEVQESADKFHQKQIQRAESVYALQAITPNVYKEQYGMNKKLTQGERQRLERERSDLQASWDLRSEKLSRLRQDLAIESSSAIQFQLQWQIKREEEEIKSLNSKLAEIEQTLAYEEIFLTPD